MHLHDHLLQHLREEMPTWLAEFQPPSRLSLDDFLSSRVVFYPGCGTDGHAVKEFGSAHAAHCFVYADYLHSEEDILGQFSRPNRCFRGYKIVVNCELPVTQFGPEGWPVERIKPFARFIILEREPNLDDDWGARRLCILFLGVDAFAAYYHLFCKTERPPFAILLEDHGYGGNHDVFGAGGQLERIATEANVFPQWLLVAENTTGWNGFGKVDGVAPGVGGMHNRQRFLHKRKPLRLTAPENQNQPYVTD